MKMKSKSLTLVVWILVYVVAAGAQTTAFTFQGKLNDGGMPAAATYDIEFKLFDVAAGTGQVGPTVAVASVTTIGGIFTVQLDFGPGVFTGADRWIEVSISPAGQNNFTTLAPRQKLGSAPYAVQTLDS